ncbi:PASTA domain, binds beta-lactams [Mariniphaga anaerophila]|uniref:PASTA domain, binds beta-lactams n=1 Tax=Mariniphaga anaerophila TaxID=1484053 RepID=A0A1M4VDX4_9BACT|nr:PASTA domain-containing protein [Mariniphaga anaerophila]SHE67199.1 PASTA domain, binds beta-lactams [Mariniphaga anaerophila]
MSFTRFLTSRAFLINLLIAVVLLAAIIFVTMTGLGNYTRHGQSTPVPDFTGLKPAEAQKIAQQLSLKVQVMDSLFLDDAAPGAVVDQVPRPKRGVKQNRTIFLTINSTQPEMVTLPQLTDISFRQAQVLIENSGLRIGNISYQPSEFDNLVLNVQIDSTNIRPGKQLTKGTAVNLIVGRQVGNQTTPLPDLIGLTVEEAQSALTAAMLNTGVIIYDESITTSEDSLSARIWRQRPNPRATSSILLGSSVDFWVTADQLKMDEALQF